MAHFRLLHLSDFHFCKQPNRRDVTQLFDARTRNAAVLKWLHRPLQNPFYPSSYDPDLAEAVARVAYNMRGRFDAALISGDLATTGLADDLDVALGFIDASPIQDWSAANNKPTLRATGRNIVLLPGNHDRYPDNYGGAGGKEFDRIFANYWPGGQTIHDRIMRKSDGEHFAVISADFSLPNNDASTGWLGRYGQGMATPDLIQSLVDRTNELREEFQAVAIVWAMHFPPLCRSVKQHMALINDDLVVAAAHENDIKFIMAGHVHEPWRYSIASGEVLCAGTATPVSNAGGNSIHLIDFEVVGGQLITLRRIDYVWDQESQDFVVKP